VVDVLVGAGGVVVGVLGVVWFAAVMVCVPAAAVCALAPVAAAARFARVALGATSAASEHVNVSSLVLFTDVKGSQSRRRYRRMSRGLQASGDALFAWGRSLFVSVAHVDTLTGEVEHRKAHASPVLAAVFGEVGFLP
jgi:hypothetical protein